MTKVGDKMLLEKRIVESYADLKTYLTSKGFTIDSNQRMRWGEAPQNTSCYWQFDDTNQGLNFVDSDGHNAFPFSLCDFSSERVTGVAFLHLKDDGCALNITPLNEGTGAGDFTLSCALGFANNTDDTLTVITMNPDVPQNGLIVCTPAESDGYWRYSWRSTPSLASNNDGEYYYAAPSFAWTIDNTHGSVLTGRDISIVSRWEVSQALCLAKVYLTDGMWSDYIYNQVLGNNESPGQIFTLNGQQFISFCPDNLKETKSNTSTYWNSYPRRCPCFLLAAEPILVNDSSSTLPYSDKTKYKAGDYCTYRGLVYKCLVNINQPEAWDQTHWSVTTVPNELAGE